MWCKNMIFLSLVWCALAIPNVVFPRTLYTGKQHTLYVKSGTVTLLKNGTEEVLATSTPSSDGLAVLLVPDIPTWYGVLRYTVDGVEENYEVNVVRNDPILLTQTDKSIYHVGEDVKIRVIAIDRSELTAATCTYTISITGSGVVLMRESRQIQPEDSGVSEFVYSIPPGLMAYDTFHIAVAAGENAYGGRYSATFAVVDKSEVKATTASFGVSCSVDEDLLVTDGQGSVKLRCSATYGNGAQVQGSVLVEARANYNAGENPWERSKYVSYSASTEKKIATQLVQNLEVDMSLSEFRSTINATSVIEWICGQVVHWRVTITDETGEKNAWIGATRLNLTPRKYSLKAQGTSSPIFSAGMPFVVDIEETLVFGGAYEIPTMLVEYNNETCDWSTTPKEKLTPVKMGDGRYRLALNITDDSSCCSLDSSLNLARVEAFCLEKCEQAIINGTCCSSDKILSCTQACTHRSMSLDYGPWTCENTCKDDAERTCEILKNGVTYDTCGEEKCSSWTNGGACASTNASVVSCKLGCQFRYTSCCQSSVSVSVVRPESFVVCTQSEYLTASRSTAPYSGNIVHTRNGEEVQFEMYLSPSLKDRVLVDQSYVVVDPRMGNVLSSSSNTSFLTLESPVKYRFNLTVADVEVMVFLSFDDGSLLSLRTTVEGDIALGSAPKISFSRNTVAPGEKVQLKIESTAPVFVRIVDQSLDQGYLPYHYQTRIDEKALRDALAPWTPYRNDFFTYVPYEIEDHSPRCPRDEHLLPPSISIPMAGKLSNATQCPWRKVFACGTGIIDPGFNVYHDPRSDLLVSATLKKFLPTFAFKKFENGEHTLTAPTSGTLELTAFSLDSTSAFAIAAPVTLQVENNVAITLRGPSSANLDEDIVLSVQILKGSAPDYSIEASDGITSMRSENIQTSGSGDVSRTTFSFLFKVTKIGRQTLRVYTDSYSEEYVVFVTSKGASRRWFSQILAPAGTDVHLSEMDAIETHLSPGYIATALDAIKRWSVATAYENLVALVAATRLIESAGASVDAATHERLRLFLLASYQRQMWFLRWDSSVATFGKENTNEEASVWLTAMTLKVLTDLRAQNVEVDKLIHLNMHAWLAKKHVEGAYHPAAPLDSRFSQVYLTATVIRALESYESAHPLETPNDALSKARAWLTAQSPTSSLDILKKSIALALPLPEVEHVDGCIAESDSTEMSALMLNALLDADDVSERPQKYRRCVLETMSENAQFGDAATSITSIEALIRYERKSEQMIDAIVKSKSYDYDVRVTSDLHTIQRLPTIDTFDAEITGKGEVLVGLLSEYPVLAHNLNRCDVSGSIDQSTLRLSISFRCNFTAGFVTLRTWTGTSPRKFIKKFTNEGEPFDGVVHAVTDDEDRRKITYWYSNSTGARLLDVEVLKEFESSSTDPGYLEICETVSMRVGGCFVMPLDRRQVNIVKPAVEDKEFTTTPEPPKRHMSASEIASWVLLGLIVLFCFVVVIKKLCKKKGADARYEYSKREDAPDSPKKQPSFLGPDFSPTNAGSRMRRGMERREERANSESSAAKIARGAALE